MKITLTQVTRFTKDKDGKPLKTKDNRPYTRLNIKCVEYGDKWMSGFDNAQTKNWQAGDEVEVEVKENGEYLNFNVPKMVLSGSFTSEDRELLQRIIASLGIINAKLDAIHEAQSTFVPNEDTPMPPF